MEKSNNLQSYLKKLEQLESELNDDSDPDEMMKQINDVLGNISTDLQVGIKEHALTATLKFINRSDNPDPSFAHEGDSGFDLRANLEKDYTIDEGDIGIIPTGLYFEVNKGLEIQIRTTRILAKSGLMVLTSYYHGEVQIILANFSNIPRTIRNGDKIAQGVVCPVYGEGNLNIIKLEKLSETIRNGGGFGSSDLK